MTEGSKVTGMKGKKKLPELPLALQSRDAGVGSARAQPPAPESRSRPWGLCQVPRGTEGRTGRARMARVTRFAMGGGGEAVQEPVSTAAPGRPFLPRATASPSPVRGPRDPPPRRVLCAPRRNRPLCSHFSREARLSERR